MKSNEFYNTVKKITLKDARYAPDAYEFVNDAVIFTVKLFEQQKGKARHVTGMELLVGIKEYAIKKFGPMSLEIFQEWGIREPISIGNIVFNMIEYNLLSKTDKDSLDDFNVNYNFEEELRRPFIPKILKRQKKLPKIA
ncbi:MAG TPA: hypothetical protein DD381_12195 [Lentisphaeria bacterium]|nr:MAG: hypothetical protein A2X47_09535 [Lentisphaerae bacterium GWF2_38_69]HBM17087.1 hypothetical protein [Lentisphaeria bacterium]